MEVLIISNKDLLINEEIRDKEVRLVGPEGEQLGIFSVADAMRIAGEKDMDLVKIAPQATPPVCKVMDYGKHKFEQAKREKEARKNQKVIELKEIRLSLNIDVHDFDTKLKNAIKFLSAGDKLKVSIRFRGREMAHPENGQKLMKRFAEDIEEYGTIDRIPKMEGRSMVMFVTSKQNAKQSAAKPAKKADDAPAAAKPETES
jgi:translation initiation factor IF-3